MNERVINIAPLLDDLRAEILREVRAEMDERIGQIYGSLLTERQAAEKLAVSRETMRQLRLSNRIEAVYIGAAVRYSRAEVDGFIERRTARRGLRKAVSVADDKSAQPLTR